MTGLKACAWFLAGVVVLVITRRLFTIDYFSPLDMLTLAASAFIAGVCMLAVWLCEDK